MSKHGRPCYGIAPRALAYRHLFPFVYGDDLLIVVAVVVVTVVSLLCYNYTSRPSYGLSWWHQVCVGSVGLVPLIVSPLDYFRALPPTTS